MSELMAALNGLRRAESDPVDKCFNIGIEAAAKVVQLFYEPHESVLESHDHMAHLLENLTNGYRFCDGDRAEIEDAIATAEKVRGGRKW